jgi:competence protein ComEA
METKTMWQDRIRGAWAGLLALAVVGALLGAATAEAQPRRRGARAEQGEAQVSRGEARSRESATAETPAGSAASGVVNLNTATEDELVRLPGIGASKARAIIEARQRNRFRRVEDVLRVRGIGRATLRRLAPMLRVEGPTTLQ